MVGRTVKPWDRRSTGEIVKWEPLGASLTDTLIRFDDGSECWYSSANLTPVDGKGLLPSRKEARERAEQEAIRSLESIRAQHVAKISEPWPGMEFGKALFGQMVDGAISDLKGKK